MEDVSGLVTGDMSLGLLARLDGSFSTKFSLLGGEERSRTWEATCPTMPWTLHGHPWMGALGVQ